MDRDANAPETRRWGKQMMNETGRAHTPDAVAIWKAGVAAVQPRALVRRHVAVRGDTLEIAGEPLALAPGARLIVTGGGKASAAMAEALEEVLPEAWLAQGRVTGVVNVPEDHVRPLRAIRLHAGRPAGSNTPTAEGVRGTEEQLHLLSTAGEQDVALCLISGGGSALLPAPVEGITLADKLVTTRAMLACGATIGEMNAVRKHLSRYKGGGAARAFTGRLLASLILSDVVGDPLDVIASGPTAADPTTFGDALAVLRRHGIEEAVPASVCAYLAAGAQGEHPETASALPDSCRNVIIGSARTALDAAADRAHGLGYDVLDLGGYVEGDTREVARALAGVLRSMARDQRPLPGPACVISGGETTVKLGPDSGKGGRNQEFVLALLSALEGTPELERLTLLCGGTDGEDGPTDAAGALATADTLSLARDLGLDPEHALTRHDAYPFFAATNALLKVGLTGTNVMDLRIFLVR